ncbi:hypothetical protein MPER_07469 [Moniliophthora perniciosa FA553]|nr:hypothetical protein MPER_07469 [Moniliophthora perniciosa FA553]
MSSPAPVTSTVHKEKLETSIISFVELFLTPMPFPGSTVIEPCRLLTRTLVGVTSYHNDDNGNHDDYRTRETRDAKGRLSGIGGTGKVAPTNMQRKSSIASYAGANYESRTRMWTGLQMFTSQHRGFGQHGQT